jgi:hypothetical protein
LGNHRYPIGFSGDAHVTWDSLAFQPYFTATAANVNYGWWSHDIGGHMGGVEDPELYARWVQFGVLSPILRLHSTSNPFHERRPWGWDAETERVATAALRLRHRFIPYLYTMAWRNHVHHQPPVRPLYHEYPALESAYHCPDQYLFGTELLAAPYVTPLDPDLRLSRQALWLPPGQWFDFFSGARYTGDGWHPVYGDLDDIPLFARAGAIVPLSTGDAVCNPEELAIHVFPGADNDFALYEDDGRAAHSLTPITTSWSDDEWSVTVGPIVGESGHLPVQRAWTVCFRGAVAEAKVSANADITTAYDLESRTLRVKAARLPPTESLTVRLAKPAGNLLAPSPGRLETCQKLVSAFRMESRAKLRLFQQLPALVEEPGDLARHELDLTGSQLRALAEVLTGAGYHRGPTRRSTSERIVVWNNQERADAVYRLAAIGLSGRAEGERARLPRFGVFTIDQDTMTFHQGDQPSVGRVTVASWFDSLAGQVRRLSMSEEVVVQFDITGDGGRTAYLLQRGKEIKVVEGTSPRADATISAAASDWLALLSGQASPESLFLEGKVGVAGNLELVLQLAGAISLSPPSTYRPDKWRLGLSVLDLWRVSLSC